MRSASIAASMCVALLVCAAPAGADIMPYEFGTTVNGFQDSFDGSALGPGWVSLGDTTDWSVSGGMLHGVENNTSGGMAHLLYEGDKSYEGEPQEVLARVRINSLGHYIAPYAAAGAAAGVSDPGNQGVNLIATNWTNYYADRSDVAMQTNADGTVTYVPYFKQYYGSWYWLRLELIDATHSRCKVWLADGATEEPTDWNWTWDDHVSVSGLAGLAGPGYAATDDTSFDVDYVLIKSANLPSILVPEPGCLLLLGAGGLALLSRRRK